MLAGVTKKVQGDLGNIKEHPPPRLCPAGPLGQLPEEKLSQWSLWRLIVLLCDVGELDVNFLRTLRLFDSKRDS